MPAVSTIRNVRLCHCSSVSMASRVVPGMSLTISRSSRSSRFTSDDLPTLGRPTMATAISSGVSTDTAPPTLPAALSWPWTASIRSCTPVPCSAAISNT